MSKKILLNQCGYIPEWKKQVTFISDSPVKFEVRRSDGTTVYSGEATTHINSVSAKESDYIGDFSDVCEEGLYYIYAEPFGESDYFMISNRSYADAFTKAIYFFYLQRCGENLPKDSKVAGVFGHEACHTTPARIYNTDEFIEVNGGWHDAGDYGRYIVPAAMTVAQLLMSYEKYPEIGKLVKNPVKSDSLPAFLQEIKYELDWMMKMQRPDGSVYHKVSCNRFCIFIMPDEEKDELIVSPVSVTATADYAAALAMAVRFFEPYDAEYAMKLKECSIKAYEALSWLSLPGGFINPEGIVTGQYEDDCDIDEKYWAAAELYKAFGNSKYRADFEKLASDKIYHGYGWSAMGSYGNIAYLSADNIDSGIADKIKKEMISLADNLLDVAVNDAYGVSLKATEYIWGSNLSVACNGVHLWDAYTLTGEVKYLDAAREQLNYLFGRNPMGLCYITGCGTDPIKRPHHRPSGYLGIPMPGMLSGGPCDWMADPIAQNTLSKDVPARCLADQTGSYSTNEVTIYWNSALILLMADLH